jgi:hypothetical protein
MFAMADEDAFPEDDEDDQDDEEEMRERIEHLREYRDEVIRQINDNDPSLHDILIGEEDDDLIVYPNDGDWEGFGASLGRSTHIKEVSMYLNTTSMGFHGVRFFQGFAMNRSIEKLDVNYVQSSDMFPLLVPFFMMYHARKGAMNVSQRLRLR